MIITLAFPSHDPTTATPLQFNLPYYLSSHLALASSTYKPYGLLSYTVEQALNPHPLTGETPKYLYYQVSRWSSLEGFKEAMGSAGAQEVMADGRMVANFGPEVWVGREVGGEGEGGSGKWGRFMGRREEMAMGGRSAGWV